MAPVIRIEINSVEVPARWQEGLTWDISDLSGAASIPIVMSKDDALPAKGQSVDIYDADTLLWAGRVLHTTLAPMSALTHRIVRVECEYVSARLRDIQVWMRLSDTTVGDWITALNDDWLSGEGFTLSVEDGPKVRGARVFQGASAETVLRELAAFATQAGYTYRLSISPDKVITFEEEDSADSAFAITEQQGRARLGSVQTNPNAGDYANIFYAESLPGGLPELTYEQTRKEAETNYAFFGDRIATMSAFRIGGVAQNIGERGRDDSNPASVDVEWGRGEHRAFRPTSTSGSWTNTEAIEADIQAQGASHMVVMDPDEIALHGRVWGEPLRVEARSLRHLAEQALAVLALRSRSAVAHLSYTVDIAAMTDRDAATDRLLVMSERPVVGQSQPVTNTAVGLSAWTGRIISTRYTCAGPSLVHCAVEVWNGAVDPSVMARAANLYGSSGLAGDSYTDYFQTTEPTLRAPALFDPEVVATEATTWTFAEV